MTSEISTGSGKVQNIVTNNLILFQPLLTLFCPVVLIIHLLPYQRKSKGYRLPFYAIIMCFYSNAVWGVLKIAFRVECGREVKYNS